MNDLILKACRLEETAKRPIWLMRQAGRYLPEYRKIRESYDVIKICKTPEVAAEVAALPVEQFGVDAAIIFADIILPLEAIGIEVAIKDQMGPIITNPIRSADQVRSLTEPQISELDFIQENVKRTRERLNDTLPVIGFSGAPFTLASYVIEGGPSRNFEYTKTMMLQHPETWRNLMDKLSVLVAQYLKMQIQAGVHLIQLFDTWIDCLNPIDYAQFVQPYSSRIIHEITRTKTPIIHYAKGTLPLLHLVSRAGGDVIGVDWRVNIDDAWRKIGHDKGIQGNLDPTVMLTDPTIIRTYTAHILKRTSSLAGHIFNLGHGVLPNTPPENVKALTDIVHNFDYEPR